MRHFPPPQKASIVECLGRRLTRREKERERVEFLFKPIGSLAVVQWDGDAESLLKKRWVETVMLFLDT
jgi:hypothetical protein